jgi:hypothetical protein
MHVFIYFIHKINEGGFTITEILFAAFYFLEKPFGSAWRDNKAVITPSNNYEQINWLFNLCDLADIGTSCLRWETSERIVGIKRS